MHLKIEYHDRLETCLGLSPERNADLQIVRGVLSKIRLPQSLAKWGFSSIDYLVFGRSCGLAEDLPRLQC